MKKYLMAFLYSYMAAIILEIISCWVLEIPRFIMGWMGGSIFFLTLKHYEKAINN